MLYRAGRWAAVEESGQKIKKEAPGASHNELIRETGACRKTVCGA
jgi:hypothetical protein